MEISHRIKNGQDQPISLWLEPWAEQYTIEPGAELVVSYTAESSPLDFELTSDLFVLWANTSHSPKILRDGREVMPDA